MFNSYSRLVRCDFSSAESYTGKLLKKGIFLFTPEKFNSVKTNLLKFLQITTISRPIHSLFGPQPLKK